MHGTIREADPADATIRAAPRRSLVIRLLGEPRVEVGGAVQPAPRGRKAWALLAYLLTSDSAPSRAWLAELLFGDADDPLNALSWNLSQLRRLLGEGASIEGDIVRLRLPPGTFVDIHALRSGASAEALDVARPDHELLRGMSFATSPAFEVWLLTERRRLAGMAEDVVREAARTRLSLGDADGAIDLASRLVTANPLDEDSQELLIRAYALAGDRERANRQREACIVLFRRELDTEPGPGVMTAASGTVAGVPSRPTASGIRARLEAGAAAMVAGAIEAAIASFRAAVAEAEAAGDAQLHRLALVKLGAALVHGVRGLDNEGAQILQRAIELGAGDGEDESAAHAHRDLGYVDLLRGRYERSMRWLHRAASLAPEASAEQGWAYAIEGVALADIGRHVDAFDRLDRALRLAEQADDDNGRAWALTFIGRSHLLRGDLPAARDALEQGLDISRRARWTAFTPLPEALLANVDLADQKIDRAIAAFEHAYQLALQLEDPCWEGIAARGLGLAAVRQGETKTGLDWIVRARTRCVRLPDAWLWVEAYCLDALADVAVRERLPDARRWIGELEALAARTGMREMVARAYIHRAALGDTAAAEAARILAAEVDNPSLRAVG